MKFLPPKELGESSFGGVRKNRRAHDASGKIAVFGVLKRGGKVFTIVVDEY